MHIQRTDLSSTEVKLVISAAKEDLAPIKDEVVARLGKSVKVQGFREGKAPQAVLEKNIDPSLLQGDFLDEAMTKLYAKATAQEKIRPVTRPEVSVKKFVPFTDLEFEVKTSMIGKIKLPDYKSIKIKKDPVTITAKDVDEVVESLRTRLSDKKSVDHAVKDGDEAVIDFKGADTDKKPIPGADGNDYPLMIGSKAFIPGFEENVIGMKPGEEKSFILTFPKDYGVVALANKKVTFTVTVKKVNELVKPALDDKLAEKIGPFKTLTELKEDIKRQVTAEREREATAKHQEATLKAVSNKSTVDIPQAIIDQQVIYNLDEVRRNLTYRGQTYEEFLKAEGKTEEQHRKELEPQAHEQIKSSLILGEIAEIENLSVQPEELDLHIQMLKGQYQDQAMQAELDKAENRQDIASRLLTEKVLQVLTS
jgi:trigger factor